jgi:hypothetical protein
MVEQPSQTRGGGDGAGSSRESCLFRLVRRSFPGIRVYRDSIISMGNQRWRFIVSTRRTEKIVAPRPAREATADSWNHARHSLCASPLLRTGLACASPCDHPCAVDIGRPVFFSFVLNLFDKRYTIVRTCDARVAGANHSSWPPPPAVQELITRGGLARRSWSLVVTGWSGSTTMRLSSIYWKWLLLKEETEKRWRNREDPPAVVGVPQKKARKKGRRQGREE